MTSQPLYEQVSAVANWPARQNRAVDIGVRAIFWRGAGSILPEKWTPELTWWNRTREESLTTSIVENRWRTYIYIYIVLSSSIFVKHALNSHFVKYILPEKLLDCPPKIILPDLGGCSPPALPAHTPMAVDRAWRSLRETTVVERRGSEVLST